MRAKLLIDSVTNAIKKAYKDAQGFPHRVHGPALEYEDGSLVWCFHGQVHRTDGPAVQMADGHEEWQVHGQYHRDGGPAITWASGTKEWYQHDKLHRLDGPAVTRTDSKDEYYVDGRPLTEEEFYRYVDQITGEVLIPPGKKLTHDKK